MIPTFESISIFPRNLVINQHQFKVHIYPTGPLNPKKETQEDLINSVQLLSNKERNEEGRRYQPLRDGYD